MAPISVAFLTANQVLGRIWEAMFLKRSIPVLLERLVNLPFTVRFKTQSLKVSFYRRVLNSVRTYVTNIHLRLTMTKQINPNGIIKFMVL